MLETASIHAVIARARRRLRLQGALEGAITASIVAIGAALVVIYAVRSGALAAATGLGLLVGCLGIVAAGALAGALRRLPAHIVAMRIDRASGLADRLATAYAFEHMLAKPGGAGGPEPTAPDNEHTVALMHAAIRDAVKAVPRANVKAATPFTWPRDMRAATAFALVATLVAGLYWVDESGATRADTRQPGPGKLAERKPANPPLDSEDMDYARGLLADVKRVARDEQSQDLEEFARAIEELLAQAERGEISKEQLLDELAKAEQEYMQGSEAELQESLAELQETGKELKKNPLTRAIGKALEQGDLGEAQEEMEKLAQRLENQELSQKQQQELAKALEQAAKQFHEREQHKQQELEEKIAEQKKQLRRLQRQEEEAKSEQEKRRLAERKKKHERELKRLERQKQERQQSQQRRALKQLHRNLEKSAQDLQKQQKKGDKDEQQKAQRMASRNLKNAAKDTGKVDADRRKIAAKKKAASQLDDLREAMRRARRKGQNGPRDLFGKNRKNEDFRRRARGQQGSRQVWRPGQKRGQQGQQGQGQNGQQGSSWGDEHDPYLMGDPTAKSGKTKDESLSGVHGRGSSRRETILAAAQKGFATKAYEEVFTDYKDIVEEVMRSEKVPSGYKYYVKRYFDKIRPEE